MALPSSSQSKAIHENVDPYTKLKGLFLEANTRTCPGDPSPDAHDPQVHLLFSAMQKSDGTVAYAISPELDKGGYTMSMTPANTMDILIDGAAAKLSTSSGSTTTHRNAGDGSYLHETIPFDTTPAQLTLLSKAALFQFRINGPHQTLQRCTDARRLRALAEFLAAAADYGPTTGAPPASPLTEQIDPSTNLKTLTLSGIATHPCPGDPSPGPDAADVHVLISANQRTDGLIFYYFTADVTHGPVLNIARGQKMQIQLDNTPGTYRTINGTRLSYSPDASGQSIQHETVAFHIHQTDLIALSKASTMEFRLEGSNSAVHRCISADQFKYLDEFIRVSAHYETSAKP